jgi:hypothetical protein
MMLATEARAEFCVSDEECRLGICQGVQVGVFGTLIPGICNNLNEGNCPTGVGDIECERVSPTPEPRVVPIPKASQPTQHPTAPFRPMYPRTPPRPQVIHIMPTGPSGGSLRPAGGTVKKVKIEISDRLSGGLR